MARALRQEAAAGDFADEGLTLETGGEDLPDAYRSVPVNPAQLRYNVIAAREPRSGEWRYLTAFAMLFGLSSSVMNFMRWSAFLEAAARRVAALLHTMYVDDGNLGDLGLAKGSGQVLLNVLFSELGTPSASAKQQRMAATGAFLGVDHDVSRAFEGRGAVSFWPKASMIDKIKGLLAEHRARNSLTPAEASKLRGILQWSSSAMFNGIGSAAMAPLKQRQYTDAPPWALSHALRRCFDYFEFVIDLAPKRSVDVCPPSCPLIVIASDARADGATAPTGGYLLVDCLTGERVGGWCAFDDAILEEWGFSPANREKGANPIALCEGAMVPIVLAHEARRCRGRRILWVLDNTSALHSFVSGRCDHATLDRSVKLMNFFKARAAKTIAGGRAVQRVAPVSLRHDHVARVGGLEKQLV